jgi:hypothetical protein
MGLPYEFAVDLPVLFIHFDVQTSKYIIFLHLLIFSHGKLL